MTKMSCALGLAALIAAGPAMGQGAPRRAEASEPTAWIVRADDASLRAGFESALSEALSGAAEAHVIGRGALERRAERAPDELPACFGSGEPCPPGRALALDRLGLGLLIDVELEPEARGVSTRYRLIDRRGEPGAPRRARAASARELALRVVGELYQATTPVSFASDPVGAEVIVDGAPIGRAPLERRLPLGAHTWSMRLEGRRTASGSIEVSGQPRSVRARLESLGARLRVDNAPPKAQIAIAGRDEAIGPGEEIELAPGIWRVTVSAPGYQSATETVELAAGERMARSIPLRPLHPLLRDLPEGAIGANRLIASAGLELAIANVSPRGARSDRLTIERLAPGQGGEAEPRALAALIGPRIEVRYGLGDLGLGSGWGELGVSALGLELLFGADESAPVELSALAEPERSEARWSGMTRLGIRPAGLVYRYVWHNLAPTAQIAPGAAIEWFDVELADGSEETLRRAYPTLSLEAGADYFLSPSLFVGARYALRDAWSPSIATTHAFSLQIGLALADPLARGAQPPERLQ